MKHAFEWLAAASLAAALAAVPLAVHAQSASPSDQAYCKALSDIYTRYVGYDQFDPDRLQKRGLLTGDIAVLQCQQGNAAAAIPVLEKKLTDQKITLPLRG